MDKSNIADRRTGKGAVAAQWDPVGNDQANELASRRSGVHLGMDGRALAAGRIRGQAPHIPSPHHGRKRLPHIEQREAHVRTVGPAAGEFVQPFDIGVADFDFGRRGEARVIELVERHPQHVGRSGGPGGQENGALQRIPFDRLAQDRRVQVTEIEPRGVHGQRQCAHAPELGRADAGVDGVQRRSELVDVRQRETPRRARRVATVQGGENGDGEEATSHAANYWVCQRLALVSYSLHALCCVDATCCMLFLARRDS